MSRFALVIYNEDHSEPCQYAKIIQADTKSRACTEAAKILHDRHFEVVLPFDYEIMEIKEKESDQDAVEIIQAYARMCIKEMRCTGCGLSCENNGTGKACEIFMKENPEKAVEIVEKWAAEHPKKTRQSEFLKMFPNARIRGDVLEIRPCDTDDNIECTDRDERCYECYRKYWLAEVK